MARGLVVVLATLVASAVAPSVAAAAQRYAAPPPLGSGTACTSDTPCDIPEAIDNAMPGDEVIVTSGDYGSMASPLMTPLVSTAANLDVHGVDGQPRPRIFGSTANDTAVLDLAGPGVKARHLELRQLAPSLRQVGLIFDGAEASDIVARTVGTQGRGCTLLGNSVLKNSVCEATGTDGVGIFPYRMTGSPEANNATIRNVTVAAPAGMTGTGIMAIGGSMPSQAQHLTVTNSIIVAYIGIQATKQSGGADAKITIDHSNFGFESTTGGGVSDDDNRDNQRFMAPAFTATDDYHQAAGSVTIDQGADDPLNGATDFDGDPRTLGGGGTDIGADEFVPPPSAVTGDPGVTTKSTAVVNGTVNANTVATTYHFEYGTTTDYGSSTPDKGGGAGGSDVPVSESLSGLTPATLYHYRLVAANRAGTAVGADKTVTTDPVQSGGGDAGGPVLGSLAIAPRAFAAAARGPSVRAARRRHRAPIGTTVTFKLDKAATVRFTVERARPGRRAGRRCAKPSRRNRRAHKCTRYVLQRGSFTVQGAAGTTRFRFTGRLRNRKLHVGRYRLVAVATDAAANRSAAKRASFKIVRR